MKIARPLLVVLLLSLAAAPCRADGIWGGIKSGTVILLEDLWYMVSSPTRLDARGWLQTAGVVGAGAVIYANDQEILDAMRRQQGEGWYDALVWVGYRWERVGLMGKTNPYYIGAAAVGLATDVEPLAVIPMQILESHITSGGIRNVAKLAIGRQRPTSDEGPYAFEPGDGTSFPSGHSSVVFEVAGVLSHHAFRVPHMGPPVWGVTHFAATSVALQRIDSESHWPSDVYLGAVLGMLTSRTVIDRWQERANGGDGFPAKPQVSWSPTFGRQTGVGVRVDVRY